MTGLVNDVWVMSGWSLWSLTPCVSHVRVVTVEFDSMCESCQGGHCGV